MIRENDFFDEDDLGRSSAEEFLEGTLLVSKDEYKEKKLPFVGNLFTGITFADSNQSPNKLGRAIKNSAPRLQSFEHQ